MKSNGKLIFGILIGALLFGSIGGYAASMLSSKDITYTSTNSNFKAGNVSDALDTLYESVDITKILPVGSVISYMGVSAPDNYLICDGTTYNITDYPFLADHIKNNFGSYNFFGGDGTTTFAVPDLRGEFLRGSGTNSHANQGSGFSVGIHQDGTTHLGTTLAYGYWLMLSSDGTSTGESPSNVDSNFGASSYSVWAETNKTTTSTYQGRYTSRPTNTSVNFIIKAK